MNDRPRIFIVNTSPLIHLAEAGYLDLLRDAADAVWVPEPVSREILAYGEDDPTAQALATSPWLIVKTLPAISPEILAWNLGAGESSVLALAHAFSGSTAVIDDLAGRRGAEALGLPLKGTVGLVLSAKFSGRIPCARAVLDELRDRGMFLSDSVLSRALRLAGE